MAAKVPTLLLVVVKEALPPERTRLAAVTAPETVVLDPLRVSVLLVAVIGARKESAPP